MFRGFVVVLKTGSVIHTIGAFKFVLPESECTHDLRASSGEITLKEFIIMAATPRAIAHTLALLSIQIFSV